MRRIFALIGISMMIVATGCGGGGGDKPPAGTPADQLAALNNQVPPLVAAAQQSCGGVVTSGLGTIAGAYAAGIPLPPPQFGAAPGSPVSLGGAPIPGSGTCTQGLMDIWKQIASICSNPDTGLTGNAGPLGSPIPSAFGNTASYGATNNPFALPPPAPPLTIGPNGALIPGSGAAQANCFINRPGAQQYAAYQMAQAGYGAVQGSGYAQLLNPSAPTYPYFYSLANGLSSYIGSNASALGLPSPTGNGYAALASGFANPSGLGSALTPQLGSLGTPASYSGAYPAAGTPIDLNAAFGSTSTSGGFTPVSGTGATNTGITWSNNSSIPTNQIANTGGSVFGATGTQTGYGVTGVTNPQIVNLGQGNSGVLDENFFNAKKVLRR